MFRFDGGAPPWTSGLSQGTALQALSRAWLRFKEPADLKAAEQALGIFRKAAPEGVRVARPGGAWYAEYTFAPQDRILNGFIQAVIGLYDFASYTKSTPGQSLFEAGDDVARVEVPHFNTGSWSMYDQHTESDLNYHDLLTEFLQNLCRLTNQGPPIPTATTTAIPHRKHSPDREHGRDWTTGPPGTRRGTGTTGAAHRERGPDRYTGPTGPSRPTGKTARPRSRSRETLSTARPRAASRAISTNRPRSHCSRTRSRQARAPESKSRCPRWRR